MPDPTPPPDGRFLVAFDDGSLVWSPEWTRLDDAYPNLVTSYTIDRGRQYELDRTDTGRATVEIADPDGVLDPTNPDGPFYLRLEPLLQAMIGRRNPITGDWHTRFRGFIDTYDYAFDPSQRVNRLAIQLVDLFEILAAIEMQPGEFGDPPPPDSATNIFFEDVDVCSDRMAQVLGPGNAGIPADYVILFSGNVQLWETVYSPGESPMSVLTEAADAEFPGVGNIYVDRFGRFVFHGRLAKFQPETLIADEEIPVSRWDWHAWKAGDGAAVHASPTNTAQIRRFAFERGLAKVINSAAATPLYSNARFPRGTELNDAETTGQLVEDTASIGLRGIRSWSAQNLLTMRGNLDGSNSLVETKKFASYYVDNYAEPQNRISEIGFRAINPVSVGAAANWALLCQVDISDAVNVTIGSPGGGGFTDEPYFVEGLHETGKPLGVDEYDDVEVTLDLSPRAYYDTVPDGWLP